MSSDSPRSIGETLMDFLEQAKAFRYMSGRALIHGEEVRVTTPYGDIAVQWCSTCLDWTRGGLRCPKCDTSWEANWEG